jgi:hypothetical protein
MGSRHRLHRPSLPASRWHQRTRRPPLLRPLLSPMVCDPILYLSLFTPLCLCSSCIRSCVYTVNHCFGYSHDENIPDLTNPRTTKTITLYPHEGCSIPSSSSSLPSADRLTERGRSLHPQRQRRQVGAAGRDGKRSLKSWQRRMH